MPHAERDTMGEPVVNGVNGEKVHSQFLSVRLFCPTSPKLREHFLTRVTHSI